MPHRGVTMAGYYDVQPSPAQLQEQMSFYFNSAVNTVVFPTLSPTDTRDIPIMLWLNASCVDTDKALKTLTAVLLMCCSHYHHRHGINC